MRLLPSSRWGVGGVTLAVWALAAGSALFWYLRAGDAGAPTSVAAAGAAPGVVQVDTRTVARTLGAPDTTAAQAAPDVLGRLALRGVVTHLGRGAALISVDGKPPLRPLRVGAAVDGVDGWSVRSVSQRTVVLTADGREARLEMPAMELRSSAGDAMAPATLPPIMPATPMLPQPSVVPPPMPPAMGMPSGAQNVPTPSGTLPARRPPGV
ncbi:MAG: hypothetical protein KA914_08785 [Ottowia sp.]|nr:hypothetical protein [Ottowia sp.]